MGVITLGGNIELDGFDTVEPGALVVVKKIVGNYAKQMSEKRTDFEKLTVGLSSIGDEFTVKATLKAGGEFKAEEHAVNMFFAMDKSLKKILSDVS
jgi:ribosome-associated translation inhibitor RaiA